LEDVVVLAVDHDAVWALYARFDGSARPKAGVDRVSELGDDDEIRDLPGRDYWFLGWFGED
jgi:hypothetical protein